MRASAASASSDADTCPASSMARASRMVRYARFSLFLFTLSNAVLSLGQRPAAKPAGYIWAKSPFGDFLNDGLESPRRRTLLLVACGFSRRAHSTPGLRP